METTELINFLQKFEGIKIEHLLIKYLIENGIDDYDKLRALLYMDNVSISSVTRNHLENAMSDYQHGILNLNKIPSIQKKN